ncbi:MAG: amidase [SAR324 cluster bacterium]|nr:amidase [SAR324 cluster bacterium]
MNQEDLCYTPATELVRAVREKSLSPVEITDAVLQTIEKLNPLLNAFCTLTADTAREDAKRAEEAVAKGEPLGALHGIPFSIKDLVITKGVRTMRGSKIYEHDVPHEDAPVVTRLRKAGGIFLGKTTTPEFGWKGMTDSLVTGVTRNPWNTSLTPGGSSGGGAAQVAAGMGPLAQGSDGGGSIRIPCAFTGIYGIKPTFGRVPIYPAGTFDALSHLGPMTRTVADAALMLSVMAGPDPVDRLCLESQPADYVGELHKGIKGLRVAWSPDLGYAKVDPEVARLCAAAAEAFSGLGCEVEEVNPGFGNPEEIFVKYWLAGAAAMLGEHLPEWEDRMDPGLVSVVKEGLKMPSVAFPRAQSARHQFYDKVRRFFENYDLLLTPTLAVLPFAAEATPTGPEDSNDWHEWMSWTPFSYPFNLTHMPAATVPAGFSKDGLPAGLHIVAPRFHDLRVLQASAAFEEARPWADKRPPI